MSYYISQDGVGHNYLSMLVNCLPYRANMRDEPNRQGASNIHPNFFAGKKTIIDENASENVYKLSTILFQPMY